MRTKTHLQEFLGKFMIFASVVYFSHFLFFALLKELYVGWRILPVCFTHGFHRYIIFISDYFTVDRGFRSVKCDAISVTFNHFISFLCCSDFIVPKTEHKRCFKKSSLFFCWIQWLSVVYVLIKAVFIIQVVLTVTANSPVDTRKIRLQGSAVLFQYAWYRHYQREFT